MKINKREKQFIVSEIRDLYEDSSSFYPLIIGVKFVSALELQQHIPELWSFLYEVTSDLILSESKYIFYQLALWILYFIESQVIKRLKDTKVPNKYFKLQGLLWGKLSRIKQQKEEGPPIMTWKEMIS